MLTEAERECAAHELCRLRGIDPGQRAAHGADPDPAGYVPAVLLYSPAWKRALREVTEHDLIMTAIDFAHGR